MQKKSYDEELGKIVLDVNQDRNDSMLYQYTYNTKYHRNDGEPARVYKSGVKEWWKHGLLHRSAGPAIMYHDKQQTDEYWIRGKQINYSTWLRRRKEK